jgi:PAS domain S-box-containing protein
MVPSFSHPDSRNSLRGVDDVSFRVFVETVRDYALLMLDTTGRIISWNSGAAAIKGYRADEILGKHFSVFYPIESVESGLPEHELVVAAREGRFEDEGWRVRKDGTRFWANVVITALRATDGTLTGYAKVTRDLTERRRHEESLRESEGRFRLLVESLVDYVIVTLDEDGMITSWNSGAERINGYSAAQILGRHFSRLYPPEDIRANKPWRQLAMAREHGRVTDESWRIRGDGTQYWANNVIATLPEAESRRRAFYMVTQDLSERRNAETLADTAQRMHEFIAMLAHELRNPLAPIRNAVALMARCKVEDPLIESMRLIIDRQSQNLTRIVDELLDVNRIARGQFVIEKQSIDLRDVIARAVETSRPLIDAHGHRLHVSIADKPIECFGDPLRLSQVVVNILNNAAKYTPKGGDIWLSAEHLGSRVDLRIRDNGRGIERDAIDRVFDLFMQVDPNSGSALGGLGVGLALVRRIVELHGGGVQALSDGLGRGSEFVVRLPLTIAGAAAQPVVEVDGASPGSMPMRILVIDDNLDAASSLGLLLQSLGHAVRIANDGPTGIAMALEFSPEIVLLDLGMPVMSGYDVARALRAAGTRYQIVAVTGWGDDVAKRKAREAGFDHHLVKPVSEAALLELFEAVTAGRTAVR